jgi:hypothetical protein
MRDLFLECFGSLYRAIVRQLNYTVASVGIRVSAAVQTEDIQYILIITSDA